LMPSYKTAFGSFLKTEDLQGKPIRVTIEDVGLQDVKGEHGVERKLVAKFAGKDKGLILNQTNCELMDQILGTDDYEAWPGHTVILYPTTTKFGNKTVPCLRIRANTAARQAPQPPPPPVSDPEELPELTDDDIPFAWLMPLVLPITGVVATCLSIV
jgi:hypothetical protein